MDKIKPSSSLFLCLSVLFGALTTIAPSVSTIIYSSLRQACVPFYFKHVQVILLAKKKKSHFNANYKKLRKVNSHPYYAKCNVYGCPILFWFSKTTLQHYAENALLKPCNDVLMASGVSNCSEFICAAFDTETKVCYLLGLRLWLGSLAYC